MQLCPSGTIPGSASSICQKLIVISTITSKTTRRSIDDESSAPLHMDELLSAIKKMKSRGVADPDNFAPSFLKSLGPLVLQELLSLFNSSFTLFSKICPKISRVAIIITLLKAGKPWVKFRLSTTSVLRCVLSNFSKEFLLIILTTSLRPKICSADSKLGFVKLRTVKIRSLK